LCCKCDVTVTFMILMSCDSVFCNASVARLGLGVVTDWWRWWPMANMLACLCSCRWLTFWTYLVTVSLFSRYTMNFMFHIALDALRVHYESMKCDVSFSQGSVSTLFRWGEHVIRVPGMCRNVLPAYSSAKIIKMKRVLAELWLQMYCHVFDESQCIKPIVILMREMRSLPFVLWSFGMLYLQQSFWVMMCLLLKANSKI